MTAVGGRVGAGVGAERSDVVTGEAEGDTVKSSGGAREPGGALARRRRRRAAQRAMEADTGLVHRKWWTPYLFLAPGLAMVALFSLWPFVNTVVLSFTDAQILRGGTFVGFDNYRRAFDDPDFWVATGNSVLYLAVVVPCLVLLPLALAVLVQAKVPGIGFFRSAFYTPVIASAVVVGLIWQWVLRSDGLVNTVFQRLNLVSEPIPFLTDSAMLLVSAMLVTVWKGLGYYMVFYLAALGNVPASLYEAAAIDGATVRRFFQHHRPPGETDDAAGRHPLRDLRAARLHRDLHPRR